jgi:hypothetical protein
MEIFDFNTSILRVAMKSAQILLDVQRQISNTPLISDQLPFKLTNYQVTNHLNILLHTLKLC